MSGAYSFFAAIEWTADFAMVAAAALLFTACLGFAAGMWYARMASTWALERAGREITRLFQVVLANLDSAQRACGVLEKFPNLALTPDQTDQLDRRRTTLLDTVTRIVDSRRAIAELAASRPAPRPEDFKLSFARTPEDLTTKLPDRAAFDANLAAMIAAGTESAIDCGLLLVKIDKFDHLRTRFGKTGAEPFLQKMAGVLCRSIREEDLVCRFGEETFAVLVPAIGHEAGRLLADGIRNAVRNYHFRKDESGPEVLVTASFGYTAIPPRDDAELALNRAADALDKSQRRGRNQLHVHDGAAVAMCAAG